jgi:hypothetical protein
MAPDQGVPQIFAKTLQPLFVLVLQPPSKCSGVADKHYGMALAWTVKQIQIRDAPWS